MKKVTFLFLFMLILASCADPTGTDPNGNGGGISRQGRTITQHNLTLHGQAVDIEGLEDSYRRLPASLATSDNYEFAGTRNAVGNWLNGILHSQLRFDIHTPGFYVAFETDAEQLSFSATLYANGTWRPSNMPVNNASGFDLFIYNGTEWVSASGATVVAVQTSGSRVATVSYNNASGQKQKYILFFPTYNGLKEGTELSLTTTPPDATVTDLNPFRENERLPLLLYGTSVTQGASGSSPSKNFSAIVALESGREVLNYGFSGRAFVGSDMADFLAQIESHIFFIDPSLNIADISEADAKEGLRYMVRTYRAAHPDTPIVMVSEFSLNDVVDKSEGEEGLYGQRVKDVYEELKSEISDLHFLSRGDISLIRNTHSVDQVHPNDAGMKIWADKYLSIINTIGK